MRALFAAVLLLLNTPGAAQFIGVPDIEGGADLVLLNDGRLQSHGWAQYYDPFGNTDEKYMEGHHVLATSTNAIVLDQLQWGVQNGTYDGTRYGVSIERTCYRASNRATAYPQNRPDSTPVHRGPWYSDVKCTAPSGGSTPPPEGGSGCVETEWFACPPPGTPTYNDSDYGCAYYDSCGTASPIVISMAPGGRYELTSLENGVWFDLDADGTRNRVAWTAAGAPLAFLAMDRNGNGIVDDGAELFGEHTPLAHGGTARHGFEALVQYDANGDGAIDGGDPVWSQLLLWTDVDHDGQSDPAELAPITHLTSLGLTHHWTGGRDRHGNLFRYKGMAAAEHGNIPYYDIYFVIVR